MTREESKEFCAQLIKAAEALSTASGEPLAEALLRIVKSLC